MVKEWENHSDLTEILRQTRLLENPLGQIHAELSRVAEVVSKTAIQQPTALSQASATAKMIEHFTKTATGTQLSSSVFKTVEQELYGQHALGKQGLLAQSLQRQLDTWKALAVPEETLVKQLGLNELRAATLAWDSSLAQIMQGFQKVNLTVNQLDLAERLLAPSRVFTEFTQRTFTRIEQSSSKKLTKALQTSLWLAEEQLLTTTDALLTVFVEPEADEVVSPPRALKLPEIQQNELIAIVEPHGEEDEVFLIQHCSATRVSNKARLVLQLVNQCNGAAKIANEQVIFKPTTRLMEVYTDFQWLLPSDQPTFADFVDCLYFLFYEGAGADNLRFLTPNGGALERGECEFIWCIKKLRNNWLRHDPDHGRESDIQKSWQSLAKNLSWLGLSHSPISEQDFRSLHNRLLHEAERFLKTMLKKMIATEDSKC